VKVFCGSISRCHSPLRSRIGLAPSVNQTVVCAGLAALSTQPVTACA
jgi:hypothetical protein